MAWLQATPKPPPGTKRAKSNAAEPRKNRRDEMKAKGITPPMPPNPLPHVTTRLVEIGLTEPGPMAAAPLSWQAINEWQKATNVSLSPWEARLIRNLSAAYVAESHSAESENCPPPWSGKVSEKEIALEVPSLKMVLG